MTLSVWITQRTQKKCFSEFNGITSVYICNHFKSSKQFIYFKYKFLQSWLIYILIYIFSYFYYTILLTATNQKYWSMYVLYIVLSTCWLSLVFHSCPIPEPDFSETSSLKERNENKRQKYVFIPIPNNMDDSVLAMEVDFGSFPCNISVVRYTDRELVRWRIYKYCNGECNNIITS